jgi:prophage regulatory protein
MKEKMESKVIRVKELRAETGLSPVTIWRLEKASLFPKRRKLGLHAVGWLRTEIEAWLESGVDKE